MNLLTLRGEAVSAKVHKATLVDGAPDHGVIYAYDASFDDNYPWLVATVTRTVDGSAWKVSQGTYHDHQVDALAHYKNRAEGLLT